jgi:hypothetical protein
MEFKNPAIIKLVSAIRAEMKGDLRCLISRLEINEKTMVVLPCKHTFHVDYYAPVRRKRRCPYCNSEYDPSLLEKECHHHDCSEVTSVQNGFCKKHNKPTCCFEITRGKNKGRVCGKICENNATLCNRHKDKHA